MPSLVQGFDEMLGQPPDFGHSSPFPSRQSSDGVSRPGFPVQYSDFPSTQQAQQRLEHQDPYNTMRNPSSSLPSIRHMRSDRTNNPMETNYSTSLPYPDGYGYGYAGGYEAEPSQYSSRRIPMYDAVQRSHQTYGETNGSGSLYTSNQSRYLSTYESPRGYGAPPGPYLETEYSPHSPNAMNGAPYPSFGMLGDSTDARSKKRRGNLPKPVTDILRAWFHEHLDHPYPSEDDKQMLIARTGLTISQVCTADLSLLIPPAHEETRLVIGSSTPDDVNSLLYETSFELKNVIEAMANLSSQITCHPRPQAFLQDEEDSGFFDFAASFWEWNCIFNGPKFFLFEDLASLGHIWKHHGVGTGSRILIPHGWTGIAFLGLAR